jgi:hypothetical protein
MTAEDFNGRKDRLEVEGHFSAGAWEMMRMTPAMIKRLHQTMCNKIDVAWLWANPGHDSASGSGWMDAQMTPLLRNPQGSSTLRCSLRSKLEEKGDTWTNEVRVKASGEQQWQQRA